MSAEARLDILTRIHRAQAGRPGPLERVPAHPSARPHAEVVAQFAEHAAEYRAQVRRLGAGELPDALRDAVGGAHVLLPPGLPGAWLSPGLGAEEDRGQGAAELGAFGVVVTGCALAIAESGTVVLDHGPGQGRRALSLLPDHHVCVVWAAQVVDTVAEAVARLGPSVRAGRPLTLISGPSATSDIELSRVEGVHGPRRLDILLVEEGEGESDP